MKTKKFLSVLIVSLFSLQTLQFTARADEGMWPFNNLPRAEIKKKYGFDITDAWLRKVQLASVRFNSGGSGSFVSADGLVMTNHHIASDVLQKISTSQKDYIKEGFYAATRDKEAKAPDLELNQLVGIEDVTGRVMSAVKPDMTTAQANAARNAEINNISAEAGKKNGLRNDVIASTRTTLNTRATTLTSRCFAFTKTISRFTPITISSGRSRGRRKVIWFLYREIPAARTGSIRLRTLSTCAILGFLCC
jgi:hypothetical protein